MLCGLRGDVWIYDLRCDFLGPPGVTSVDKRVSMVRGRARSGISQTLSGLDRS